MKSPKQGPEYSRDREFTVILEDLRSQFRVFGEGLQMVHDRLDKIEDHLGGTDNRLERMEMDVRIIKTAFQPFASQVSDHETRITALEHPRR